MRVGLVTLAYHEPRFITPFLKHIPDWIEEKLVLISTVPWQGLPEKIIDHTAKLAELAGGYVVQHDWPTEHAQRNAGQDWFYDMDWIIILDPDEFLDRQGWDNLREFLEHEADTSAFVCRSQYTYWKHGGVISPPEEYKQIIAVRPSVRFVDKRVVNTNWGYAPVDLHHFSWARTNQEVIKKISHYSHAHEIDAEKWYKEVWLADKRENVHPLTPEALKKVIEANLPKELEELQLWP